MAVMPSLNDDEILRDMHEAADALGIDRVGLMGFCMGGMYCHKAARSDRFARISSFYGMIHIPEGWMSATQGDPLAYLEGGNADRVLAIIGSLDPYTPPDQVMELRAVGVTVQEYPEAVHGFAHDAARPAHRVDDAQDAFSRTRDWLLTS
jgi:dienelactone hydrolase